MADVRYFEYFITKGTLSWFGDHNPIDLKYFRYTLTQYTPSVYAELLFLVNNRDFEDFLSIEKLPIKDRIVKVYFEPELYNLRTNKKYFSGEYEFCVVNYSTIEYPITELDLKYEDINDNKLVLLKCVDPIFYSMQTNEKTESFGKTTISKIVEKIVKRNGGSIKVLEPTGYSYNWLQAQLTDYEMIRSLLPYAKSTDGQIMYNFFMFNKECYFGPITKSIKNPLKAFVDMGKNNVTPFASFINKHNIEKYGDLNNFKITHRGFPDFKIVKPESMSIQSYMSDAPVSKKQHPGIANNNLITSIDDEELEKIYISNLRHRIYTFSKMLTIKTDLFDELTPLSCVELISQEDGKIKDLDGLYYVISCTYNFGKSNKYPFEPHMKICLSSDVDSYSIDSPEGRPLI